MFSYPIFALLTLITTTYGSVVTCKQRDPCRCQTEDSDINLHIFSARGFPSFRVTDGDVDYTYSPCKGLPCGEGVKNDSLCASSGKGKSFKDLGDISTFKFIYDSDHVTWSINYTSKDNKTKSTVKLFCDTLSEDTFSFLSNNVSSAHYVFNLTSPCVCSGGCVAVTKGLSPGTVLLLIFFSLVALYFGVGILYRKTVYGAEGREIIPHTSFWFSLPGLIRDGYLFFISPCLGESVEYRRYDRL